MDETAQPDPFGTGAPNTEVSAEGAKAANDISPNEMTSKPPSISELKIEFEASSDPHGRITVYQVEVLG